MSTEHEKTNLVQIAERINSGQLPTNQQIKCELEPVKKLLEEKELTAKSYVEEHALKETRKFVEAVDEALENINAGDRIQNLTLAAGRVAERVQPQGGAIERWEETKDFVAALKDLVTELIKSENFRKTLLDFFKIGKEICCWQEQQVAAPLSKLESDTADGKSLVDTGKELIEETKKIIQNMAEEDLPEAHKQLIRQHLKELMMEIRKRPESGVALKKFLKLWSLLSTDLTVHLEHVKNDKDVQEVQNLSIELLEAFAGGKSINPLLERLKIAVEYFQNDKQLQDYLKECRDFLTCAVDAPELLEKEEFYNEADELVRKGRGYAQRYKNNPILNAAMDEANAFIEAIKSDEHLANLQYRAQKAARAMTLTDAQGNIKLDYDILNTFRQELIPFFIDRIKEVPVPGFRIENDDFEYLIIDDLYLSVPEIIPDKIVIHSKNDTNITLKNLSEPIISDSVIKFKMEGLRPTFKDFSFRFRRRGMLHLSDEGKATLTVTGKGVCIYLTFKLELDADSKTILGAHKVDITIDGISVNITEANHATILNLIVPFFTARIQHEVQNSLKTRVEGIGGEWAIYLNNKVLKSIPIPLAKTVIPELIKA